MDCRAGGSCMKTVDLVGLVHIPTLPLGKCFTSLNLFFPMCKMGIMIPVSPRCALQNCVLGWWEASGFVPLNHLMSLSFLNTPGGGHKMSRRCDPCL